MLLLQSHIITLPVASVQAGHKVGSVTGFVIKPQGLTINALKVLSPISDMPLYLHTEDILETRQRGVLIDHNEQLMDGEDLVRLAKLLEINFEVIGKKVVDESNKKIGSVVDYIVNTSGWQIQKIHIQPSLIKMLGKPDRIVDRSQIIKVTEREIVIASGSIKSRKFSQVLSKQLAMRSLNASQSNRD